MFHIAKLGVHLGLHCPNLIPKDPELFKDEAFDIVGHVEGIHQGRVSWGERANPDNHRMERQNKRFFMETMRFATLTASSQSTSDLR